MLGRLTSLLRRGYVKPYEVPIWKYDAFNFAIPNLINCKQHKEFLTVNEDQLPPAFICASLNQMTTLGIQLDENWPEICQLVKRNLKTFDMYAIRHIYKVARCMALLGETNEELWEIVEDKLVKQGLSRYLTEQQAARLMYGLYKVGKGTDELWKRLEAEVHRHADAMKTSDLKEAVEALEVTGRGSKATIEKLKTRLGHKLLLRG